MSNFLSHCRTGRCKIFEIYFEMAVCAARASGGGGGHCCSIKTYKDNLGVGQSAEASRDHRTRTRMVRTQKQRRFYFSKLFSSF